MSNSQPKSRKEWLKDVEDYGVLKNLATILINRAKTILLEDSTQTWEQICQKASGRYFKYEYLADHKLRVTDKSTKLFVEKPLPAVTLVNRVLTPLPVAPSL